MCNQTNRGFSWNWAIAMKSGALDQVIRMYKYGGPGQRGWAKIFGRILVGFLEAHAEPFRGFDLIIASPADPGAFDHTREVLKEAAYEDMFNLEAWPFDATVAPPVMVRTQPVKRFAGKNFQQRLAIAEQELLPALRVVDPKRVAGRRVLVYDDVFTTGLTLHTVGKVLEASGAEEVCGISLARAPFRGRST